MSKKSKRRTSRVPSSEGAPNGLAVEKGGRATITDVARLANVSVQTVSNVLHGRFERMTQATRDRVSDAILKLDYYPSAHASRMRQGRSQTIVVAVLDPSPSFLSDAFTAEVLSGAAHEARKRGYKLLLYGSTLTSAGEELADILRSREADGLILIPSGSEDEWGGILEAVARTRRPFVCVQSEIDLPRPGLSLGASVRADDYGAGVACGQLLARLRHRQTLFVTTEASWAAVERRLQGIRDVFSKRGILQPRVIAAKAYSTGAAAEAVRAFLVGSVDWSPSAIVGANDVLAVGALMAARSMGIDVPGTLSVVGFDDLDIAGAATPPLSTVRVPGLEIGARAVEDVISRVEDPTIQPIATVLPVELVERESTATANSRRDDKKDPSEDQANPRAAGGGASVHG